MHSDLALKLTADLFWVALLAASPALGATLLVGLAVGVLQVVTQLQDMSLSFIPKLLAAGAAVIAFGPWTLKLLCGYAVQLWTGIPGLF